MAHSPQSAPPPPADVVLAAYLEHLQAAGLRQPTIELRMRYLRRVPNPVQASTDELLGWMATQTWAPGTRANARGHLRVFYRWLRRRGYRDDDPAEDLPTVRIPPGVPRPAPDDVVVPALLAGSDKVRLLIGLAGFAGLRRAELATLPWAAIADGQLRIVGKGGKVRTVPLSPVLAELLEAERVRRHDGRVGAGFGGVDPQSRYVFPGSQQGHISPKTVGRIVGVALGPGWTTHTLRHRFATLAYGAERDLFAVQRLLGHASPVTTARYAGPPAAAAAAAVLAASAGLDVTRS